MAGPAERAASGDRSLPQSDGQARAVARRRSSRRGGVAGRCSLSAVVGGKSYFRYVALHTYTIAIPKDEFDRLKESDSDLAVYEAGTNAHTILQFLASNSEQAFPPKEIADETGIPPGSVRGTLSRLAETGLLEQADKYWSINEAELASQRAALVSQQAIDTDQYGGYDCEAGAENAELPPERAPREE